MWAFGDGAIEKPSFVSANLGISAPTSGAPQLGRFRSRAALESGAFEAKVGLE